MADHSIQVEYNQDLQPLEQLLSKVRRTGDFLVSGVMEIPLPKLEVEGAGVLSFPVPPAQAAAVIRQAARAPYGRGEATILDESVRKVWQLPPAKVRLSGKSWTANFAAILQQVIVGLGCEGLPVSAELYKLLVYDQGGFFLSHRDTEKLPGMFGTLIIGLPSAHRGGELVVRHAGREMVVDMSTAEGSEITFAAFYADCEHEVRRVTEGYRICLVYNLLQHGGEQHAGESIQAPEYEPQIAAAAKLLEACLAPAGAPAKLAWLLEHQYSPDGLAFAALKSVDAARVRVLVQAAERAGCTAHLGIVHIEESGSAEPKYFAPYRRRRYHDEEDDVEDAGSDDFEVVDVCDWRHYISQWRNLSDQPVEFGQIPLAPGELLPAGALDQEKPDQQRLTEASGNEGASFERSYHRAALLIWRHERYAEVLLQAGVAAVLPHLKERMAAADTAGAPPSARPDALRLAQRLVVAWQAAPEHSGLREPGRPARRDEMLGLLNTLGDPALLEEFIGQVVVRDYDGSENAALAACAGLLPAKIIGQLFSRLVQPHMRFLYGPCVDLLDALAAKNRGVKSKDPAYPAALRQIAQAIVRQLAEVGKKPAANVWMDWSMTQKARPVDAALVVKLLDILDRLDAPELRSAAVTEFIARPAVFDPVTILTPALAEVRKWDAALWEHCVDFLLRRSGQPPAAPSDWRQAVKLACACADCRELQAFALDPARQIHRFRVRQDRRQHLHQQIEAHKLDMTHVTDRKGSPQTLVCTKDRRSYQNQCTQYRQDMAALGLLAESAQRANLRSADTLKRIAAARTAGATWSP